MNNLADNIIKKIKDGEINMQPRWHFVLRTVLLLLGVVIASFVTVYLFSFVIFILHKSGLWFAPQYGTRGLLMFALETPWLLLSILGMFLLILYVLVHQYSFSYKKPLVYSIVAVVLLVTGLSSTIHYLGLHERLESFAERHNVPGLHPFYKGQVERRPEGVYLGVVIALSENRVLLQTDKGEELEVIINNRTKLPSNLRLESGLEVLVFGDRGGEVVSAFGIRSAKNGSLDLPTNRRDFEGSNTHRELVPVKGDQD